MNKIPFLFSIIFIFSACQQDKSDLTIDIKNIPFQRVALQEVEGPNFKLIDSATIKENDTFNLSAPLGQEKMYRLTFEKGKNFLLALKKGDQLKINGDWVAIENCTITGSESSQAVNQLDKTRRQNKVDSRTFKLIFDSLEARGDQKKLEQAKQEFKSSQQGYTNYLKGIADSSKSAVASLMAVNLIDPEIDAPFVTKFYEQVQNRFPNNDLVTLYSEHFVGSKKISAAPVNTSKGNRAPDFSAQTPDGRMIGLSDYKGKYVLVDFWAAWCGPCRGENPNVVKAYEKFKDKNFDVLGVSLDTDKENWKKAIAKDGLAWQQISELQGWSSSIAKKYQVTSIPANFLIDPDGYIIATGLRGEGLINKLSKVIK